MRRYDIKEINFRVRLFIAFYINRERERERVIWGTWNQTVVTLIFS